MDTKDIIKEYKNNEIKVIWTPDLCVHSMVCFIQLPEVFQMGKRPWIKMGNSSTDKIVDIVEACPTDALKWEWLDKSKNKTLAQEAKTNTKKDKSEDIIIFANGPLNIPKSIDVKGPNGEIIMPGENKFICRCGQSKNLPHCDGSHILSDFKG